MYDIATCTKEDREIYAARSTGNSDAALVCALMIHDSHKAATDFRSSLPMLADKGGDRPTLDANGRRCTVARMVRNRIEAHMRGDSDPMKSTARY